jgi:hypothetical protein
MDPQVARRGLSIPVIAFQGIEYKTCLYFIERSGLALNFWNLCPSWLQFLRQIFNSDDSIST